MVCCRCRRRLTASLTYERADDEHQFGSDQRRQHVAERLATAGGHDDKHVAACLERGRARWKQGGGGGPLCQNVGVSGADGLLAHTRMPSQKPELVTLQGGANRGLLGVSEG